MWTCDDIHHVTDEILAYLDTNNDGSINPEDDIESSHYSDLVMYCDVNNDGSISKCEMFDCVV
jgi:hypothetical protein